MRIVYENIAFALGIKALCLLLGAFGLANMWTAIFADVGVMVLAVLNAIPGHVGQNGSIILESGAELRRFLSYSRRSFQFGMGFGSIRIGV